MSGQTIQYIKTKGMQLREQRDKAKAPGPEFGSQETPEANGHERLSGPKHCFLIKDGRMRTQPCECTKKKDCIDRSLHSEMGNPTAALPCLSFLTISLDNTRTHSPVPRRSWLNGGSEILIFCPMTVMTLF